MIPLTASEARALSGTYDDGFEDLFNRIRTAAVAKERYVEFSAYEKEHPWAVWIFQMGFKNFTKRMEELGYIVYQSGMARFNIYWHKQDVI